MDGGTFADGVMIPNPCARQPALPFQVLGFETDTGKRIDLVVGTEPGMAVNHHMRMEPAAGPEGHVWPEDAVRTDLAVEPDFGTRRNDGGGVDHLENPKSEIRNPKEGRNPKSGPGGQPAP